MSNQSVVGTSGFALSDPADMNEISCYGVFIGGPVSEPALNASSCQSSAGAEIARFGIVAGLFPKNASVDLYVPSGPSRRIYVFGMKSSGACEMGVGIKLDESRYSQPFLLGQVVADLRPGDNSIPLEVSFDPAMKMADCSFMPTATPGISALTLSRNSKTLAKNAFYNFSAAGGKPPYTFSVASGGGTIDATGAFTAPGTVGFTTIRLTDSVGTFVTSIVQTVEPGTTATDFAASGFATANASSDDRIKDLAIQPDGKIVAVGSIMGGAFRDWGVARFNVDGTLDTSFSGDGLLTHSISSTQDELLSSVAIQPDGKIVVAGQCGWNISHVCLARLNSDGSFDTSFGSAGFIDDDVTGSNFNSRARKVFVDKTTGKITVLCDIDTAGDTFWDMCAARYTSAGVRDSSFGSGGLSTIDLGGEDHLDSGIIGADGSIYMVGAKSAGNSVAAVVKLTPAGALDVSFDSDGKWFGSSVAGGQQARDIAFQSTGKLIVAIHDRSVGSGQLLITRMNTNGSIDASFASSGHLAKDFNSSYNDIPTRLYVQPDDRILIGGVGNTITSDAFVLRLSANGAFDTSFNNPNSKIFSSNIESNAITGVTDLAMSIGPNGAIFIGGTKLNTDQDFRIWKLLSDSD